MLRKLGRALAIAVVVIAGLTTPLCVAVAIDNDGDSDLIVGGVILALFSAGVTVGAWFVQRALRRDRLPAGQPMAGLPAAPQQAASHMPTGVQLPGLSEDSGTGGRTSLLAGGLLTVACVVAVIVLVT